MKTKNLDQLSKLNYNLKMSPIKQLNRAEFFAWVFFIGGGIYTMLSILK